MKCSKKPIFIAILFLFSCTTHDSNQEEITIFSIGDSTMADYNVESLSEKYGGKNYPLRGFMMMAPLFFNNNAKIHNAAVSGRSSKSFRDLGDWGKVINKIKPGDYVLIQFGHNDAKSDDPTRYTEPTITFKQNLINYINETKAKGGHPILLTSIVRRKFENGKLVDTHGDYVKVPRTLAVEMNIPLIDLNRITEGFIQDLGEERSKDIFLHIAPGLFTEYPNGLQDNTHLSVNGGLAIASLTVEELKKINSPLAKYIKPFAEYVK